jgi:uncharacterized delta-60 repeat protein
MSGLGSFQGAPSESYVDEGDDQLTLSALSLPAGVTVTQWNVDWNGDGTTDQTIAGTGASSVSVTRNLDGDALTRIHATATLSNASVVTGESRSPSGDLDDTFAGGVASGGDGIVLGTAVDTQGRTVVVYNHKDFGANAWQIKLRRYGKDGSLDTAFGTPTVPFDFTQFEDDAAIVTQGDKVVVGGTTRSLANLPGDNYDFAVARFTSSGALDTSFGSGGRQVIMASGDDSISALTVQGGKIVAAGRSGSGAGVSDFQVARFTSEGLIDSTFGTILTPGYVRTNAYTGEGATDVAATPDGGIVAAGSGFDGQFKPLVVKYNASGTEAWRSNLGVAGGYGSKASLAVQSDGKIVVAGSVSNDVALARLLSTGAADTSFGTGGLFTDPTPAVDTVTGVAIGGDGALYTAGGTGSTGNLSFGLTRYAMTLGVVQRDFNFGAGGSVVLSFGNDFTGADSLAVTPGGSLVLAGSTGALDNFSQTQPMVNVAHVGGDLQVLVQNVAPQVVQVGTLGGVPGQTQQLQVTDPSAADRAAGYSGYIDYDFHGDGDEDGTTFEGTAVPTHVYTVNGSFNVLAQIFDKDGFGTFIQPATEGVDSVTYNITKTLRTADPVNPGKTVLFVGATDTASGAGVANTIKFSTTATNASVNIDGVTTSVAAVNRIVIYGNGGDDTIQPTGTVSIPVEIYAGAGADKIKGGNGADVLVGGDGDDLITGGVGRNFMVGGNGADKVVGDVDDDILVGGVYVNATDRKSVNAIMAEWTSSRTYPQRVDNLRNGGGANGTVRLVGLSGGTAQTIFDDGAQDKLTGDLSTDWFFANVDGTVKDKITDLSGTEFTDADRAFVSGV